MEAKCQCGAAGSQVPVVQEDRATPGVVLLVLDRHMCFRFPTGFQYASRRVHSPGHEEGLVADVDLGDGSHGMIRVRAKEVGEESWQPKTKVNRAVPVSSALRCYLERYAPMITPGRWLFPSTQGCLYDPDNFSRDLRNVNHRAGFR